jgi:hypothetical protein
MSASLCNYCEFGKCNLDDERCEYDNIDYEDECHKFLKRRKKRRDDDDDDDDDSGLLGLGLGIASIALGGSSGGFGGFGGGGFGGGGGGGKF